MDALNTAYFSGIVTGAVLAAVCRVLCFFRAAKQRDRSLFFYLLAGFYACVFMSDTFYLLTWALVDYPYELSPGVLSWVGAVVFLITVALDFTDRWTPEQKKAANKHRLPALIAPATCAGFYAVCAHIYPEEIAIYLLYAVPALILSYLALWLCLTGGQSGLAALTPYHLATLVWIAADLLHNLLTTLGWSYGYAVHCTVCLWLLMLVTLLIYHTTSKGADA